MKVLYLSTTSFFDADLGFLKAQNKKNDFHYLINIPTYGRSATALNITTDFKEAGIYPATEFEEFQQFKDYLNLEKTYVIYRTSKKTLSLSNLSLQKEIVKFIIGLNPEIIHLNDFVDFNFLYLLIKKRFPIVQTIHDPFPHSGSNSLKEKLIAEVNNFFIKKRILLNSSQSESYIIKNKVKKDDIYISRLGTYDYLEIFQKNLENNERSNQILFFGRISPYKGIEELCRVILELIPDFQDLRLIIAGSGDFYFDIQPYAKNPNFEIINRYITIEEMVRLFHESKFLVCPYKDATQSGVILSAFGLNKPVVATNVGGIAEVIEDQKTGLLVAPDNHDALKEKIKALLVNPELLDHLQNEIKDSKLKGKNNWTTIVDDLQKFYYSIINENYTN